MKKIIQLFILTIGFLSAEIEFQSKLYITPFDDSGLEVINENTLCIRGKHGLYSVDVTNMKKPKILKNTTCFIDLNKSVKNQLTSIKSNVLEGFENLFYYDKNHLISSHDNLCDSFTNSIELIDIQDSLKHKVLQTVKIKDFMHEIRVEGNRIFFLGNKGLRVYKINLPTKVKSKWEIKEKIAKNKLL